MKSIKIKSNILKKNFENYKLLSGKVTTKFSSKDGSLQYRSYHYQQGNQMKRSQIHTCEGIKEEE